MCDKHSITNMCYWYQLYTSLAVSVLLLSSGTCFGWSSPSIPKLLSDRNISSEIVSYIAITSSFGSIFGSPAGAYMADIFGRKITLLLISFPFLLHWIIIAMAKNPWVFVAARFIFGFGEGMLESSYLTYLGEIAHPKIRGSVCSFNILSYILGTLIVNIVGSYLSLSATAIVFLILPVVFVILFTQMPESPYYFLMKNNQEAAKKSLQTLNCKIDVDEELSYLSKAVQRQMSERSSFKDLLFIRNHRKSLFIVIQLRTFEQFSGTYAFSTYNQIIFQQAGGNVTPLVSSNIYLSVQIVSFFLSTIVVDRCGRKPLLLLSSVFSGLALVIVGTYFYIKQNTDVNISGVTWIPLLGLVIYVVVYSVGLGTIPSIMTGELFSASIKAKALSIIGPVYSVETSIVSKSYQLMSDNFGIYMPFYFYGICCFIAFVISYILVPETKQQSLEEIQLHLKRNPENKS